MRLYLLIVFFIIHSYFFVNCLTFQKAVEVECPYPYRLCQNTTDCPRNFKCKIPSCTHSDCKLDSKCQPSGCKRDCVADSGYCSPISPQNTCPFSYKICSSSADCLSLGASYECKRQVCTPSFCRLDANCALSGCTKDCRRNMGYCGPKPSTTPPPTKTCPYSYKICNSTKDCPKISGLSLECKKQTCTASSCKLDANCNLTICTRDCRRNIGYCARTTSTKTCPYSYKVCKTTKDCPKIDGVSLECKKQNCTASSCKLDANCALSGCTKDCRRNMGYCAGTTSTSPATPASPVSPATPASPPSPVTPASPPSPVTPDSPASPGSPATPPAPSPAPTKCPYSYKTCTSSNDCPTIRGIVLQCKKQVCTSSACQLNAQCQPTTCTADCRRNLGYCTSATSKTRSPSPKKCPFKYTTCKRKSDCPPSTTCKLQQCTSSSCSLDANCKPTTCTLDCGRNMGYCVLS